jgi:hypothetical protein
MIAKTRGTAAGLYFEFILDEICNPADAAATSSSSGEEKGEIQILVF